MIDNMGSVSWCSPVCAVDGSRIRVEMRGLPLLLYGARLADAVLSSGSSSSSSRLVAKGAFGGWVAPYVADRLARYETISIVRWTPPLEPSEGEAPQSLVVGVPKTVGAPNEVYVMPPEAFQVASLQRDELSTAESVWLPEIFFNPKDEPGTLTIALAPNYIPSPKTVLALGQSIGLPGTVGKLALDEKLRTLVEQGFDADQEDHGLYADIVGRIGVPTSERSRNHAG